MQARKVKTRQYLTLDGSSGVTRPSAGLPRSVRHSFVSGGPRRSFRYRLGRPSVSSMIHRGGKFFSGLNAEKRVQLRSPVKHRWSSMYSQALDEEERQLPSQEGDRIIFHPASGIPIRGLSLPPRTPLFIHKSVTS